MTDRHRCGCCVQTAMAAPEVDRGPQALVEGMVAGVGHLQRSEDVLLGVDVERLAAEFFDERAEGDEVDVGVDEVGAGSGVERRVHGAADAFGFVGCGEAPGVFEVDIGRKAGVVGEQFADGDLALCR